MGTYQDILYMKSACEHFSRYHCYLQNHILYLYSFFQEVKLRLTGFIMYKDRHLSLNQPSNTRNFLTVIKPPDRNTLPLQPSRIGTHTGINRNTSGLVVKHDLDLHGVTIAAYAECRVEGFGVWGSNTAQPN